MSTIPGPARVFRWMAVAEAVTWALLLTGMVLKYGTRTTELGVQVFGMAHGVVFVAYVLTTLVIWVDQRWSARRGLVGILAAVPPFATVWFDLATERSALLGPGWRLAGTTGSRGPAERTVAALLRHPAAAVLIGAISVGVLTCAALALGPPAA